MVEQSPAIAATSVFRLEHLTVDARRNTIVTEEVSTSIEPRLMRVIVKLAQHAGEVVDRDSLLKEISEQAYASDESLTQAISKIRQVLGDSTKRPQFIKTVPRKGYVLMAEVGALEPEGASSRPEMKEKGQTEQPGLTRYLTLKVLASSVVMLMLALALMVYLWPEPNRFIEQGEIEFIEQGSEEDKSGEPN